MLVFLAAVVLTLSFAVPAEDVPETPYDESASLPYVSAPVVSLTVPELIAKAPEVSSAVPESVAEGPAARPRASRLRLGFVRRPGAQPCDRGTRWAYPVSDSLTILDHSLRC